MLSSRAISLVVVTKAPAPHVKINQPVFFTSAALILASQFNNVAMTFFTGYGTSIPYAHGQLFLYSSPFAGTISQLGTGSNFLASTTGANDAFSFGSSLIVEGGTKYYAYLDGETPPLQFGRSNAYAGGELFEAGRGNGFQFQKVSSLDFRFGVAGSSMLSAVPEPASWAMMLLGFGVIGGPLRSRRQPVFKFA